MESVFIIAHEYNSRSQLLLQERLEDLENHIEDIGLVYNIQAFDSKRNAFLQKNINIY